MTTPLVVRAVPPFSLPGEAEQARQEAEHLLDASELARGRAMEPVARDRFLAGRVVQRRFVAGLLSVAATRLTANYSCLACGAGRGISHGRPGYLLDGGPAPLALSLSRTAGWTLLAAVVDATPDMRLGVDVEDPARTGFDGFSALALTAGEQRSLQALAGNALLAERARLWARKEAWLKMTGDGLRTAPSAVDVLDRTRIRDLGPAETGLPARLAAAVALSTRAGDPL